jgi:uncharacterized membrane protein
MKVAWIVLIVILPYLGVFVYLLAEHRGMADRAVKQQTTAQAEMDEYVRSVAANSDPTAQIARAQELLSHGTISQAEFDQIKHRALAA